jgi:hypothetical protein
MKRARFVFLAVAAAALAGCGDNVPPSQNYATVTGRVYDAATNAGIAGVTVTASTILTTTTAADGTYRIQNVPIGQNEVQVSPPTGYTAANGGFYPIAPQPGETLTVNIPLTKS